VLRLITLRLSLAGYRRLFTALPILITFVILLWQGHHLFTSPVKASAFTPGNVVIYRVGTGASSLIGSNAPAQVFLDEYTTGGTFVQSIPMPTAVSGSNKILTATAQSSSEGELTLSTDGSRLVLTGYNAALGSTTNLPGTSGSTVNRVVGLVDSSGVIDTTTGLTDFATGGNPRSATSDGAGNLWLGGSVGGVRYATVGATTSTQLSTNVTNVRQVKIFGGQLYVSDSSGGAIRLGTVGTGTPTTSGQTISNLVGFPIVTNNPVNNSPYSYYFAKLGGSECPFDTLYVVDDANTNSGTTAGIQKYSQVSGTWISNGTIAGDSMRGLTGVINGGSSVTLYVTSWNSSTGASTLYSLTDASGYNAPITGSLTTLATAATNTAFRGVAFAPSNAAPSPTPFCTPTATPTPTSTCPNPSPAPIGCGTERWSVKTGTDADRNLVNLNSATPTTIAALSAMPSPNPTPPNNRVAPAETTQWIVHGTITQYKLEDDSDYHVVFRDGSNTMVTEIPYPGSSPQCVQLTSPFLPGIASARCKFDGMFLVTTSFKTTTTVARIKGVGMFDFPHGQTGAAPNQIELHPILDVTFLAPANGTTNAGTNTQTQAGEVTLLFSNVSSGGTTTVTPIEPSSAGTAPSGYTLVGPADNITTTASVSGPITVCFSVPYITDYASFSKLKVLHSVGGNLVDITTGQNVGSGVVCGNEPSGSLSPFVVAIGNTPTAAPAALTGRVTNSEGDPLGGVLVNLGGSKTARAITDSEGMYSFTGVETGGFYVVTPEMANYRFSPATRAISLLGNRADASFTALETSQTTNPLETPEFFVRQQYLDFLGREPDQGGLDYWSDQLRACGQDEACMRQRRIDVSAAFFMEEEPQDTGFFVYRVFRAAFGQKPGYSEFNSDRSQMVTGAYRSVNKSIFVSNFVKRADFKTKYPDTLTNAEFVGRLYNSAGLNFSIADQQDAIREMEQGATRADIIKELIEKPAFMQREYNPAFVLMQYFGYLRRDPDEGGYGFWLDVLNNRIQGNYRAMVCAFISSAEYQQRFSPVRTRTDTACGQ